MRLIDADAIPYEPLPKGDRNYRTYNLDDAYEDGYNDAMVDVRNSPTIEEPKKGKWEEREVSSEKAIDKWQSARCSVCGKYHTTPYMYYFDGYNYCPNCGADMRGEQDE